MRISQTITYSNSLVQARRGVVRPVLRVYIERMSCAGALAQRATADIVMLWLAAALLTIAAAPEPAAAVAHGIEGMFSSQSDSVSLILIT